MSHIMTQFWPLIDAGCAKTQQNGSLTDNSCKKAVQPLFWKKKVDTMDWGKETPRERSFFFLFWYRCSTRRAKQWRKRDIFQEGGRAKSLFLIFPDLKCFFSVEISILIDPKQISVVSQSKKPPSKKKVLCSVSYFSPSILNFPPSLQYSFSSSQFSLLSLPLFSW